MNKVDESGNFGTPIQWACAIIGALLGLPFGKWLANKLGYYSGWKYFAIRAAAVVGGAVLGWFAGSYLIKLVKSYLVNHPETFLKIYSRYGSKALVRFKNIFGIQTFNKNAFSSWLYYKATGYATSSAAIGRLFEKWYYYYYGISSKFQQVSITINGVKMRLDAILNGRIIELKNYNWSKYSSYGSIINSFLNQVYKYKQLIGKTINGQTIKGITFYFSSKPPQEVIRALERVGVKVQWVK